GEQTRANAPKTKTKRRRARPRRNRRAAAMARKMAMPAGARSPRAPSSQPKHPRQRCFVRGIGGAELTVAQVFCAHTPPSGHSLSVVQGAEDAAGLASSGAVGGACGGHFVGGGSPGIWGNLPVMAVVTCTLFGFCGVAPMATRLLYLLMAMVKYVSSPSSDV